MAPTVDELDALPADRAADLLSACCAASRWVSRMVARRPFGSKDALLRAADDVWHSMDEGDFREAFAHHPRIGERASDVAQNTRGAAWSAGEQARVERATDDVHAALAKVNREYEKRFGHIYIVSATGRSAEELLALAEERLSHSPHEEMLIAAEEQRKILQLRLEKLLGDTHTRRDA
jgi:2-oxo-4-hydroxy-4-carboxy-5-ureidoimidazoline decarboxylase